MATFIHACMHLFPLEYVIHILYHSLRILPTLLFGCHECFSNHFWKIYNDFGNLVIVVWILSHVFSPPKDFIYSSLSQWECLPNLLKTRWGNKDMLKFYKNKQWNKFRLICANVLQSKSINCLLVYLLACFIFMKKLIFCENKWKKYIFF